jgi:hypothetical protein
MHVIEARNVNDAYAQAIRLFQPYLDIGGGRWEDSRVGPALSVNFPVTTHFRKPSERVLWDAHRDCNPFLHLFESLWMLAGRDDVAYISQFNQKMADFSDDGMFFNGAYGNRWRYHFGYDQIEACVKMLRKDPKTRRCILTMWSPDDLVNETSKDLPCNLMVKFRIVEGALDMQVFNRSNDMIWGAYGANAVHMAFLQEYVAHLVGVSVGHYWQISGDFHVYKAIWETKVRETMRVDPDQYIGRKPVVAFPLGGDPDLLHSEIQAFVDGSFFATSNWFLSEICQPLLDIWRDWKEKNRARALLTIQRHPHQTNDWITACRLWMERRIEK